ncbi:hypothetical protein K438DRAFT_1769417 [Mycena galopus ATCC 62051]|nr:hypothetical protein K438DRAFT_1769417 [Mycena galopus ATCC 62051]
MLKYSQSVLAATFVELGPPSEDAPPQEPAAYQDPEMSNLFRVVVRFRKILDALKTRSRQSVMAAFGLRVQCLGDVYHLDSLFAIVRGCLRSPLVFMSCLTIPNNAVAGCPTPSGCPPDKTTAKRKQTRCGALRPPSIASVIVFFKRTADQRYRDKGVSFRVLARGMLWALRRFLRQMLWARVYKLYIHGAVESLSFHTTQKFLKQLCDIGNIMGVANAISCVPSCRIQDCFLSRLVEILMDAATVPPFACCGKRKQIFKNRVRGSAVWIPRSPA